MPMRLRTASEAIPVVGFVASQLGGETGLSLPEGLAAPVGILILGVYVTVYVAKAVTEMRRNGPGPSPSRQPNGAVMAAGIAHIEKTVGDIAIELRTIHVRLDVQGERLTRAEGNAESQSRELQRIRQEGCQQLQRHRRLLDDLDEAER